LYYSPGYRGQSKIILVVFVIIFYADINILYHSFDIFAYSKFNVTNDLSICVEKRE